MRPSDSHLKKQDWLVGRGNLPFVLHYTGVNLILNTSLPRDVESSRIPRLIVNESIQ